MPPFSTATLLICLGYAIGRSSSFISPATSVLLLNSKPLPTTTPGASSLTEDMAWGLFGRRGGGGGKKEKKPSKSNLPEKTCVVCGRPFAWRKKWERCWDEVTCCSKSCNAKRRSGSNGPNEEG